MSGFALTQFGSLAGPRSTPTTITIPPGSYGVNPVVVVSLVGDVFNGTDLILSGAGVPNGFTAGSSNSSFTNGFAGANTSGVSRIMCPRASLLVPNPLDLGVDVVIRRNPAFGGGQYMFAAGASYFIGVLSWSAGPDARSPNLNWMPIVSQSSLAAWDKTASSATGTLRKLPSEYTEPPNAYDPLAFPGDPLTSTSWGYQGIFGGSVRSDPTMPVAPAIYLGRASSSTPSIPSFVEPTLPGWQDVASYHNGQYVISVGLWTQSLAGLDIDGRVNGNFKVSNMPALASSFDAWGIIYTPVGQGVVLGGHSWVAVIG